MSKRTAPIVTAEPSAALASCIHSAMCASRVRKNRSSSSSPIPVLFWFRQLSLRLS
jgi:hypothetical protein